MIDLEDIDTDILRRVIICIYGEKVDFDVIETKVDDKLDRKTVITKDLESGNVEKLFSIDRRLNVDSHDGTDRNSIIDCFRKMGIHAN